jgi:hypothetical protein
MYWSALSANNSSAEKHANVVFPFERRLHHALQITFQGNL